MYIETIPRRLGRLGRHLMDTGRGSNDLVVVRADLSRDLAGDVKLTLRLLAAPARRVRRMKRDVAHIVISPDRMLSADEQEHVLRTIEVEYGIPEGSARLVVEHQKGNRPHHFHVVYSMASEIDGKALRFERSGDRDEMLARRLEIELGVTINPSTRVARTVELLRKRGLNDIADIAAEGPVAEKNRRQSKSEMRQDARLGVDPALVDARLLQAWRQAGGDLSHLRGAIETMGFRLGAGDKRIAGVPIVQLIDTETLKMTSLTRHLNRLGVYGDAPRLREVTISASVGELLPAKDVKAQLRKDAPQRSAAVLLGEFDQLIAETEPDGERLEAAKARKGRDRLTARLSAEEKEDLRTRQGRVQEHYRQRDRIRRARVNRAFIAAGLFGGREIRKAAFYLVAVGILATGAGLIPALAVAGITVATIPTFHSAKRLRAAADREATLERSEMGDEVREETQRFFRERAVARRVDEQKENARRARMRDDQANRQRMAQADLLRRQQHIQRQRQLAQLEAQSRRRAAQDRLAPQPPGQDPIGARQVPRRPPPVRQRPRVRDIER